MQIKNIKTEAMLPWLAYATYDEDGFVNGVRDDSPAEIKRLYEEHQKENRSLIDEGDMISK